MNTMKVKDLINELSKYNPESYVVATWESIIEEIYVYKSRDGVVLIDANSGFYREEFENGRKNPLEIIKEWEEDD